MALHTTPCCCWQCKGTNSSLIRKQTFMITRGLSLFLLSFGTYFLLKILRLHSILLWIAILSYPTLLEFYFSGMKYAHIPSIFFLLPLGICFHCHIFAQSQTCFLWDPHLENIKCLLEIFMEHTNSHHLLGHMGFTWTCPVSSYPVLWSL